MLTFYFRAFNICYMMEYFLIFAILIGGIYCDSCLMKYLQPDDIDSGKYDNVKAAANHICTRECKLGDHRTCYYRFVIEPYVTMNGACGNCPNKTSDCEAKQCVTGDGFEKAILTINRKMPGPSIQVCQGDKVVVDMKNMMPGRSITIHWHGLRQINDKFMDGVPMVTQCPVLESQIFRYHFKAESAGTQFYHSHSGLQKMDGIVGSFVVRRPKENDPNNKLYDFDHPSHVIVIQEWKHECSDCIFPGLQKRGRDQHPDTYLIQGKGSHTNGSFPFFTCNVTKDKRHVFRIVAGTCFTCQYTMTIEKHDFTIIAADGPSTKPYKVKSLTMSPGERLTAVVDCNKPVGSYWMEVRAVGFCEETRAYQLAILRYNGHNGIPSTPKPGYGNVTRVNDMLPTMNPFNSDCSLKSKKELGPCVADLRGAHPTPKNLYGKADKRLIWAVGFYPFPNNSPYRNTSENKYHKYIAPGDNAIFSSTINGMSHNHAPSPLLSQWKDIPRNVFCPEYDLRDVDRWNTDVRECVHIFKVPANKLIEIVSVDNGKAGMSHPIHLHGYDMCVVEQGILPNLGNNTSFKDQLAALLQYLDSDKRKPVPLYCPMKDTVPLTAHGYIVSRIYTNNPGYWFFHCHFAYHLESGMAGVLKVGEHHEMPDPPKGFPRCKDYLPILKDCDFRCFN